MAEIRWRMDGFQEMPEDYIYDFLKEEQKAIRGAVHVFDHVCLPRWKKQGINAVNLSVGGEHCTQVMYSNTDTLRFWDAHKKLDILNSELEAGCQSFLLVRTAEDIDRAARAGKIAIFATLTGGKPLEGKSNLNLLSSLRSLYRMGLRSVQLTGNTRNRLADGVGQSRTHGKLTGFGKAVVEECNRLGILLDTAQISDYGFYDILSLTDHPVIDSHSCALEVSDHPRNLSRERIKAIAESGGVVGISFRAALVQMAKQQVTMEDLIRQIEYMIEVAGIEHVAVGPDYCPFQTPTDREHIVGFGNLGPDASNYDYRTPMMSEKYPGYIENVWYGVRKNDFVETVSECESFPNLEKELRRRGYREKELDYLLGENLIRVYRQVLPKENA